MSIHQKVSITQTTQSKLATTDLINPVFGEVYADHMFCCDFKKGAWQDMKIIPYETSLSVQQIQPCTMRLRFSKA